MKKLTSAACAAAFLILAGSGAAAIFDAHAFYDLQVKLTQTVLCDGP